MATGWTCEACPERGEGDSTVAMYEEAEAHKAETNHGVKVHYLSLDEFRVRRAHKKFVESRGGRESRLIAGPPPDLFSVVTSFSAPLLDVDPSANDTIGDAVSPAFDHHRTLLDGPNAVHHDDPWTSHAAAMKSLAKSKGNRRRMLEAYRTFGPMTDHDAGAAANVVTEYDGPRTATWLRKQGLIEFTGVVGRSPRGNPANLSQITSLGARALANVDSSSSSTMQGKG